MKARKRLDAITESAREKMQDEVSALLGKKLGFSSLSSQIISKEDYFSDLVGKFVLAKLDIQGSLEGEGYLLVSLKDAIRIGGTLIMLPDTELAEAAANDDYSEDTEDSYGEIANILAGSFTTTFEEQYPKPVRFVRTTQEIVIPTKVEIESDDPCPDQQYYHLSTSMELEGQEMGEMHFLLPGELFGVVEKTEEKKPDEEQKTQPVENQTAADPKEKVGVIDAEADDSGDQTSLGVVTNQDGEVDSTSGKEQTESPKPKVDVNKQKKRIDSVLKSCCEKMAEEVGALLGIDYKLSDLKNSVYDKEECLDQLQGKQVLARMDVRGDEGNESFLFCGLKDAILLGGKLIMLPDTEIEKAISEEDFNDDGKDAYGEIANIIAGVYTAVFEEQYKKSIGFVKTGLDSIIPVKIDPDSDDTFINTRYYHVSASMSLDGKELGTLQTIFPAALFQLETYGQADVKDEVTSEAKKPPAEATHADGPRTVQAESDGNEVLIVTENDTESQTIASLLENNGFAARVLHFSDDVNNYLPGNIGLVFLVMNEINEKGLSVAIKIRTAGGNGLPMVVAGPSWTRSKVLKAVKYGADDILITPAQSADIEEKIQANLQQKAA